MTFKPFPELAALGDPQAKQTALSYCLSEFVYSRDEERRFRALCNSIFLMFPKFVKHASYDPVKGPLFVPTHLWNPWLERNLRAFVNEKYAVRRGDSVFRSITLTGAGSAGKTFAAGLYSFVWWAAKQYESIAILTSTSKGMIRKRMWPVIANCYRDAYDLVSGQKLEFGHMVDSQIKLQCEKGRDEFSISAHAVADGETQKAIHNLKGMHAPRMLLAIDEANGTPEAICEIIANYRKACQDLTVIILGNPCSRLDPHGRALTPEDGWKSISEDTIEWRTTGVPEWQLDGGIALRFDGRDSPNVKLGFNKHKYIYTLDDWNNAHANPNYVGTLNYWVFERGLHPPEGTAMTVFTELLFLRCLDGSDQHFTFDSDVKHLAFLDPAFTAGGDKAWYQTAVMGKVGGRMCIQLLEGFDFPISPDVQSYDVDYQLATHFINACRSRKVEPNCCGIDATGGGRGVASHIAGEWSPAVHFQTWGGAASERPCAQYDNAPAREVYANKVTEMWFNVRDALEAGQIKGFSKTAMGQACSRMYKLQGRKRQIEPKDEMKSRVRYSPDEFDAIAGLFSVAMANGFEILGSVGKVASTDWTKQVQEAQEESALDIDQIVTVSDSGGWSEKVDW